MGVKSIGIGVKMKKGVIFTIKGIFNHPFLVGMLCLLIFVYRSCPFVFSLLVSAFPFLVCTAALLGALLSFGQPNIPQIVVEYRTFHEAVSLKTAAPGANTSVIGGQNISSFSLERLSEKKTNIQGQSSMNDQPSLSIGKLGEILGTGISEDTALLIKEKSREMELENGGVWEKSIELSDKRYKEKDEWNEERFSDAEVVVENHYAKVNDERRLESDEERSEADSFDSERANVDPLDSPPHSPWKGMGEKKEGDEDDGGLDSGSDRAESSSPDASMADLMPMLDELHPLLDEDAPQTVHMSNNESCAVSLRSSKSSTYSRDSDDESENNDDMMEEEVLGDFIEDGEDEEDKGTKPAITWTEEDEKNLMDLGSSEIERNQWLEKLIMRRRERKTMSVMPEMNLIDLESSDLPFNVAPISISRQNPFDFARDSYDIPGSAPSVLVPRLNPFDIPYGSTEEKPNIIGGGFLQENYMSFQSREPFYRTRESFNVGPSFFSPIREDRQDIRFRPYFVPERMIPEEPSYSPLLRQSSEASDSKVSSGPETESLGSVEEFEDRKVIDEQDRPEVLKSIPSTNKITGKSASAGPELISKVEKVTEADVVQEPVLISNIEHVSEHIGHGSQSSEERYSTDSSFSSLSDLSERIFIETEGEGSSVSERRKDSNAGITTQTSVESTTILRSKRDAVDDVAHKEPVYDSSPPSVRKNSSSSISSGLHIEADIPIVVKRTVSFIERESEGTSQATESPIVRPVYAHNFGPSNIVNPKEADKIKYEVAGVDKRSGSEGASVSHVPIPLNEHKSGPSNVVKTKEAEKIKSEVAGVDKRSGSQGASVSHVPVPLNEHKSGPSNVVNTKEADKIESEAARLDERSESEGVSVSHVPVPLDEHKSGPSNAVNTEEADKIKSEVAGVDKRSESEVVSVSHVPVPLDEHKSGPSYVVNKKESDKIKFEVAGVDKRSDSKGVSVSHVPIPSESPVKALVEKNPINQQTQSQVPGSISGENALAAASSSGDRDPVERAENRNSTIPEGHRTVEVSGQSSESQLNLNGSSGKEEIKENVEIHVESPSSDSDIYHEAYEKLMLTPSAEGNPISFFYDDKMHEPTVKQHRSEAQVQKTVTELLDAARTLHELNMPVLQELDQEMLSNVNSPLTPDFISIPSTASETASSHTDAQTMSEDADVIREIDERLMLELESVGDHSISHWGPGSVEFEKRIDSVEVNTLKLAVRSGISREEIVRHEEGMNRTSERQKTSERDAEHLNISVKELNERDGQNSSQEQKPSKINETKPVSSVVSEVPKDGNSGKPEVDSLAKKPESTSVETEHSRESTLVSHQSQIRPPTIMPEVEARTLDDIKLAFKQIKDKDKENGKLDVSEAHKSASTSEEAEHSKDAILQRTSNVISSTKETPIPEVSAKDTSLEKKQVSEGSTAPKSSENTALPPKKVLDDDHVKQLKPNSSGSAEEVKVGKVEPLVVKESTTEEAKKVLDGNKGEQLKPDTGKGSAEIKARIVESSVEKESISKETLMKELDGCAEKRMKPEARDGSGEAERGKVEFSVDKETTLKEAVKLESDGNKEKQIKPETKDGLGEVEGKTGASVDKESTLKETAKQVSDGNKEKHMKPETKDGSEGVKAGKVNSFVEKESALKETVKQVSDDNKGKQSMPASRDGSGEVQAGKVESSVMYKESTSKVTTLPAAEKTDHEVKSKIS